MKGAGKVVEVEIFGQVYPIRAKVASEDYIRKIAGYVDAKMHEIHSTLNPSSTMKVAVLTALNIADELFSLLDERNNQAASIQQRVRKYTEALDRGLHDGS